MCPLFSGMAFLLLTSEADFDVSRMGHLWGTEFGT